MTPVEARPLPAAVDAAYKKYLADHYGDLSNPEELAEVLFNAGGRHAVTAMVAFGDIVPQLHRVEAKVRVLLELLEGFS